MNVQTYQTTDGDPVSLWSLVRLEPDWAVSRIKEIERLESERGALAQVLGCEPDHVAMIDRATAIVYELEGN